MKLSIHSIKYLFYLLLFSTFLIACDNDDDDSDNKSTTPMHTDNFDYHVHVHSPDNSDKHMNDTMHVHIEFEEHDGKTIHNIKVRIYNQDDTNLVIYSEPTDGHIHADGATEHHANIVLDTNNGFFPHSDWTLEAKAWGHDDGEAEKSVTVDFHVHPHL